jgi:hypothetical protein
MDDESKLSPPYGPAANLKTIFDTWRDRSMPEIVSKDWLERIGISPNLTAKNLHALRYLGLIDDSGYTTDVAQRLRTATSEEYTTVLEEIVRKAYRSIFAIREPAVDSRNRIEDAFRTEQPQAQRPRMVACFLGLCVLAGMPLKEAPPARETSSPKKGPAVQRKPREAPEPAPSPAAEAPRATDNRPRQLVRPDALDPVLGGLINTVPQIETVAELEEWYQVFRAAFSYVKTMREKNKSEVDC